MDDTPDQAKTELRGPPEPGSSPSEPRTIGDPDAEIVVYPFEERYEIKKRLGES